SAAGDPRLENYGAAERGHGGTGIGEVPGHAESRHGDPGGLQLPGREELVVGQSHRTGIADDDADVGPEGGTVPRKLREFLTHRGDDQVDALLDDKPAQ